jgi:hypothetical protein
MTIRKLSALCYGDSGTGKSTQARYFAKYTYEKHGLRTRALILDTGSGSAHLDDYVDAGFVDVVMVPLAPEYNPFAIMRKLGRGEWPVGGVINKPTETKDSTGKKVFRTNTVWEPWGDKQTQTIGLIVLDSLTAYSTAYMYDAAVKNIRKGSEAGSDARSEDGEQYGSNTQSHYGDVQNECKALINSLVSLPNPFVYITALGDAGTEDVSGTKRPVLGPQVAGKAAIGEIPKLVTNCFHLTADGNGPARTVKAWYEDHPDSVIKTNNWRAKASSIVVEDRPEFMKKYPLGYIPLSMEKGIREFLEVKDQFDAKRAPKEAA